MIPAKKSIIKPWVFIDKYLFLLIIKESIIKLWVFFDKYLFLVNVKECIAIISFIIY